MRWGTPLRSSCGAINRRLRRNIFRLALLLTVCCIIRTRTQLFDFLAFGRKGQGDNAQLENGDLPARWEHVHLTWETRDLPKEQDKYREAWLGLGFKISISDSSERLADFERLSRLLNNSDYVKVYKELETPVQKADLWKYCKIFMDGGLYADIDIEPMPSLRSFVTEHSDAELLLFHENSDTWFERLKVWIGPPVSTLTYVPQVRANFFGAVAAHEGLKRTLDNVVTNVLKKGMKSQLHDLRSTLMLTGPGIFTRSLLEFGGNPGTVATTYRDGSRLFSHNGMGTWKPKK